MFNPVFANGKVSGMVIIMNNICAFLYKITFSLGYKGVPVLPRTVISMVVLLPLCVLLIVIGQKVYKDFRPRVVGICVIALPWAGFAREGYLALRQVEGSPAIKLHHSVFLIIAIVYVLYSLLSKNRLKLVFEIPIALGASILFMRMVPPFIACDGWTRYFGIFPFQFLLKFFLMLVTVLPEKRIIKVISFLCVATLCLFGCRQVRHIMEQDFNSEKQSSRYALLGLRLLIAAIFSLIVLGTETFFWALFLVIPGYLLLFSQGIRQTPRFLGYSLLYTLFGGGAVFACGIGDSQKEIASAVAGAMGALSRLLPLPHGGAAGFFKFYFSENAADRNIFPQLLSDICFFAVPVLVLCICYFVFWRPAFQNKKLSVFLKNNVRFWQGFIITAFLTAALNGFVADTLGVGHLTRSLLELLPERIGNILYCVLEVCIAYLIRDFLLVITAQIPESEQYGRIGLMFLTVWLCTSLYSDLLLAILFLAVCAALIMVGAQIFLAVTKASVEIGQSIIDENKPDDMVTVRIDGETYMVLRQYAHLGGSEIVYRDADGNEKTLFQEGLGSSLYRTESGEIIRNQAGGFFDRP